MGKIMKFLVMMLIITSCTAEKKQDDVYLKINNKELEYQIIEYTKIVESEIKNRSFVITVYCAEVNDSTSRYMINGIIDPKMVKMIPYHFICKVGEHDVFFTMLPGIVKKDSGKRNFFDLKESAYSDFMEKYFPKDYKYYKENKQKEFQVMYEPDMCYLTFVYDKLVKKEMKSGLHWWR